MPKPCEPSAADAALIRAHYEARFPIGGKVPDDRREEVIAALSAHAVVRDGRVIEIRSAAPDRTLRRAAPMRCAGVEVRDAAKGPGTIHGVAAVYYDPANEGTRYMIWDDVEERVLPGCFARALREKDDVRILRDHNPSLLLGRTSAGTARLADSAEGLRYEADAPDTELGRDTVTAIKRGDLSGSSFGFIVEEDEVVRETRKGQPYYVRNLKSVMLVDASCVAFPAYPASSVGARHSLPPEVRAALVARAQDPAPSPESPEAMKAKADQQAAAQQALVDGQRRRRELDMKERE